MKVISRKSPLALWSFRSLALAAILVLFTIPAMAQETVERKVIHIEVKDGKVYVNGEMVKELENKDARIRFSRDGDDDFVFFSDDGDAAHRRFAFRSPRFLEELGNEPVMGFAGRDFPNAYHEFDVAFDLEPLHENLAILREGMNAPYVVSSTNNKEIMRLERKSRDIARKLRNSEGEEREELNQELENMLNQIFDMKLESLQERIEKMSGELDELRARVQERVSSRAEIINRRLRELRGERNTLDW